VRRHPQVESIRWDEHPIGIRERANLDAVEPDHERLAPVQERRARGRGRTNEIGNGETADLDDLIAQPSHPACLLDAVRLAEPEVLADVGAHVVGVEMHGVEAQRELLSQRGFAGAGQAHDQNLFVHNESISLQQPATRLAHQVY